MHTSAELTLPLDGTYAFATVSGESQCPREAGTVAREEPGISYTSSPLLTHPEKDARFHLRLVNNARVGDVHYILRLDPVGLEDDVKVYVEGLPMREDILFVMDASSSTEVLVQVYRGSEKTKYDLAFSFRSQCEPVTRFTALTVPVEFAPKCPLTALYVPGMGPDGSFHVQDDTVAFQVRHML